MTTNPADVWKPAQPTDELLSMTNEPLTDGMVRAVEQRIGQALPESYVTLLRTLNGGFVRNKRHPLVNGEIDSIWGIGRKASSTVGSHDWSEELEHMRAQGITEPRGLERMVPFAGDGHYFVCFDYNHLEDAEPTIAFVDLELHKPAVTVAKSFERFVSELRAED